MHAPDRSQFLHAPADYRVPNIGDANRELLDSVTESFRNFQETCGYQHNELLWGEAKFSAAIENEFDDQRIKNHAFSLSELVDEHPGRTSLLEFHQQMMVGQSHAQPGMYRTVNVVVGRHLPPRHPLVPSFMAEFFEYLEKSEDVPLLKAAWAHMQFETIHPFADGNGRTGRALINQILASPLPLSCIIYKNRQTYYGMLDSGSWAIYLKWFLGCVHEEIAHNTEHDWTAA